MKQITIEIATELSEAIEARQIELNGLQRLIGFALSTTEYDIPQEKIQQLQADYIKTNAEYDLLKESIQSLIPEDFDLSKTSWTLDFKTHTVTVDEK